VAGSGLERDTEILIPPNRIRLASGRKTAIGMVPLRQIFSSRFATAAFRINVAKIS
jgi:hypothetical protein